MLNLTFSDALDEFCAQATSMESLSPETIKSYRSHLNTLEKANGGATIQWIKDTISHSRDYSECIDFLIGLYDGFMLPIPATLTVKKRAPYIKSALVNFATFILSYFNASAAVLWGNMISNVHVAQLVAQTAIFPSQSVVDDVIAGKLGRKENLLSNRSYQKDNPNASWDYMSSIRGSSQKGKMVDGLYHDFNTRANHAIKQAILHSLNWTKKSKVKYFSGFEACHIYDKVGDPNYYTSIMNLVLVPRAFAALTDHHDYVKEVLKYRVYELFRFTAGNPAPKPPKGYREIKWR